MFTTGAVLLFGSIFTGIGYIYGHVKGFEDGEKHEQVYQQCLENIKTHKTNKQG